MPEHATETSVVVRATDKFPGTDENGHRHPRDVVLKLMKNEKQFNNEQKQREYLDPKYLLKVIYTSTDHDLKDKWTQELPPIYRDYKFGIVMVREGSFTRHAMQHSPDTPHPAPPPLPASPLPSGT